MDMSKEVNTVEAGKEVATKVPMSTPKKVAIIGGIVVGVAALAVGAYFIFGNKGTVADTAEKSW